MMATHERCPPAQWPGAGMECAAEQIESPCSTASRALPLCRAANRGDKTLKKKKRNQ